jgi:hypothetical protein
MLQHGIHLIEIKFCEASRPWNQLSVAVTWIYVTHKVQKWHLSDYPFKQRFSCAGTELRSNQALVRLMRTQSREEMEDHVMDME